MISVQCLDSAYPDLLCTVVIGGLVFRCAAQLLRRNEQQLQHPLQRLLIDMMDGNAKDTELADDCQSLLQQVQSVSAQI